MINRTVIAAAALLLSVAAAEGAGPGDAQPATAAVDTADEGELRPAQIERLRILYIDLRKSANDRCARRHALGAMAAKERCFHDTLRRCFQDTLRRLVADVGDPSLTRYHLYIDGIARPSG